MALFEEDDRLDLVPKRRETQLVERDGLLVVAGSEVIGVDQLDHRLLREERLAHLGAGE